ncbi:MAG: universal stress protein [Alphaproteobacteria bacterium]|nr:universal stress protein [Alphaproteobacteria bacterium]
MTGDLSKVLVTVDGSPQAERAVRHAIELHKIGQVREMHLLNVQPPLSGDVASFVDKPTRDDYHREEADKALDSARKLFKAAGIAFKEHVGVGQPAPAIVAFAKKLGCGQIVMGTHGLGAALRLVLGSVAQEVVRESEAAVTVVK